MWKGGLCRSERKSMRNFKNVLAVIAIGFLAGPIVVQAQVDYDYQTIDYPEAESVQVFGINDRGDAVGTGYADLDSFPFVYGTKKGTLTDVPPVAGFDRTSILGISDSGDLVGSVAKDDLLTESGLILDKKGNATVFDHPDAVSFTQARGVNNKGLVTGYRDSVDGVSTGFIYHRKTNSFTDIVPSLFTIAQGINSRGDVVGSATFENANSPCPGSPDSLPRYGWLRTADGNVSYFDVNGGRTSARGITDSGTIAGFVTDTTTGVTKGFVVNLDGSQCQSITIPDDDLLAVPGASETFVGDIKNSGEVVGSYYYGDPTYLRGYIATPQ